MKKNQLILPKKRQYRKWATAFCFCAFLLGMSSCADGIDDKERFSGGVTNAQLESPKLADANFATLANTDGTESVKMTWPVVYGAGGYSLKVNIVDDPTNPVSVVDSIVDGCSMVFKRLEDTKYEIALKTLGNEKLNNKEAVSATVYDYSTLTPATTVPEGQDVAEFIRANMQVSDKEQAFELQAGKTYTLNSVLDFDLNTITFRGDKANRPMVVVGADGGLVTQGGLKVKFINFDCTAMKQIGMLNLSATPSESISTEALGYKADEANQNGYVINNPIIFQECNFKNVKNSFLYGNKKNWSLRDYRIVECIIQLNSSSSNSVIELSGASNGLIKDLMIKNSTFYNLANNTSGYFIRYSNASNAQPKKIFGNAGNSTTFNISYNTFCKTMSGKDFANATPTINTSTLNVHHNIFYDTYRINKIMVSNTVKYYPGNTIWNVTQSPDATDTGTYATLEDPGFPGPINVEFDLSLPGGGVNFQPTAPKAIEYKSGDPRWY